MIIKTAREIWRNAQTLANAGNSTFADFALVTNLLNANYRVVYDAIVQNTLAFTNKIETNEPSLILPHDFYTIISVVDQSNNAYIQSSDISHNDNGYYIENGIIYLPKKFNNTIFTITYSTIPATLTAPAEWIKIDNPSGLTSNYYYYCDYNDGVVTYTRHTNSKYLGKSFSRSDQKITWDGEDVSDYFAREGTTITNFQYHSPYAMVSYSDGKVFIFTGFKGVEWNYNSIFGHETNGVVVALKTDDTTGFGCVFHNSDDDNYYYAPFVPDTILRYPTNALFNYLEYRVAWQIASLLGMQPQVEFLRNMMQEAETEFYKTISNGNNSKLLTNFNSRRLGYTW